MPAKSLATSAQEPLLEYYPLKSDYLRNGSIEVAFATPILTKQISDTAETNAALRALALKHEQATPGVGRSNVGGWQSPFSDNVFEWPSPAVATLRDLVSEGITEITQFCLADPLEKTAQITMSGTAWINLCRDGDYNKIHSHPTHTWSGVYYVSVGTPDPRAPRDSGRLEFLDPRLGATTLVDMNGVRDVIPKRSTVPRAGLLVIFPSWLYHSVNPFRGGGERISVAFNIDINVSFGDSTPSRGQKQFATDKQKPG